jgi:NO-binding membrane sensor protein with MHYT domain
MISYSHDMSLFIASVVVSFVAAFTGLALTNNISRLPDAQRKALIVMSAFILGGGIWSMHFVAMLAVKIDQTIYYDLLQTLGSALVAILVAGLALLILHFSKRTRKMLTLAGVILGFGIVAMHFIGMNGMRGVTPKVSIGVVLLTIVVAIATGVAAIRAAYGNRSRQNIIAGAAVFGSAVVAVHFTAMHGTQFVPGPPPDSQSVFIGDGTLAVTVTITVFIICGAFLLAATTFISRPPQSSSVSSQSLTSPKAVSSSNPVTDVNTKEPAQPTTDGRVDDRHNATLNASGHAAVTRSSPSGAAGSTGALNEPPVHDNRAVADAVRQSQTAPVSQPVVDSSQTQSIDEATLAGSESTYPQPSIKIPFERNKKILFVDGAEVGAIRADGRYTHLYTESGTLLCPWSITEAETRLADHGFFRSHRSYLVNLAHLSGFEKNRDAGVCLFDNLQQLTSVPVSRKRVPELITVLGI